MRPARKREVVERLSAANGERRDEEKIGFGYCVSGNRFTCRSRSRHLSGHRGFSPRGRRGIDRSIAISSDNSARHHRRFDRPLQKKNPARIRRSGGINSKHPVSGARPFYDPKRIRRRSIEGHGRGSLKLWPVAPRPISLTQTARRLSPRGRNIFPEKSYRDERQNRHLCSSRFQEVER